MKDNQKELKEAMEEAFKAPTSAWEEKVAQEEQQVAESWHKGHGRMEHRRLVSTTILNGYLDWPGVGQVCQVERTRIVQGKESREVAYRITSVQRKDGDAAKLLEWVRGHWGIENSLFGVRDGTLGEDRCRVRSGWASQVLAALRDLVVSLLNALGWKNKASALRHYAARPEKALALVCGSPKN